VEVCVILVVGFFFSSRRRHTRFSRDWSSDVCSSDLKFHFVVFVFLFRKLHYPTLPSSEMLTSFCASTANSMGRFCKTSRQKPLRSEERRVGRECKSRSSHSQATTDN